MTTYTSEEFATRVLKDLGLIAAEETPSGADLEWAQETCNSEIMLLNAIGIPVWNGSEISIPQEYLSTLSRRVGLALAPSYGLTDMASAQAAMREAERALITLAAPRVTDPTPLRTDDARRAGTSSLFNFTLGG